jgi:geranylgeranyl pyrophosphate synthase
MERLKEIVEKRGRGAIEKAGDAIRNMEHGSDSVSSALEYFSRVTLIRGLPVFPALISLSCEAVGGNPNKTDSIGAALTLLAAAADIHDDVIDQSETKYGKKTVFGKFGNDIAILTGDALLFGGFSLLNREYELLSKKQRTKIQSLLLEAFREISGAEAKETATRKFITTPQDYLKIIEAKAAVPELHCKVGAIIGNGSDKVTKSFGNYGRIFGILSIIRDEFIDLLEYRELQSRIKNEVPPLPVLYALQDPKIAPEIEAFLTDSNFTKKIADEIVTLVLGSVQVKQLRRMMADMINDGLSCVALTREKNMAEELRTLLSANLEEL